MNYSWFKRRWFNLRSGHNNYLSFFLSFTNFLLIAYNFFIVAIFDIDLALFAVIAATCYIPLAIIIGHIHKKRQLDTDAEISYKVILDKIDALEKKLKENGVIE